MASSALWASVGGALKVSRGPAPSLEAGSFTAGYFGIPSQARGSAPISMPSKMQAAKAYAALGAENVPLGQNRSAQGAVSSSSPLYPLMLLGKTRSSTVNSRRSGCTWSR